MGSTGWSDFCSGCSGEAGPEFREAPETAARRRRPVSWAVVILFLVGLLGLTVWNLVREEGVQGVRSERGEALPHVVSDAEETDEQKYERLLLSFVALSKEKCDSVRTCRHNMDIISYRELVDSVYFPFVFTFCGTLSGGRQNASSPMMNCRGCAMATMSGSDAVKYVRI